MSSFKIFDIAGSGISAQSVRLNTVASNLANADGNIYSPNVNVIEEMTDMISASRAYQNNVEVMNTSKQLMLATLKLGS